MKPIYYRTNQGVRTGLLVKTGRKYHNIILMDNPIRMITVPISEERHFSELLYKGKPYPETRAKRLLRNAAKVYHGGLRHCSKSVRAALA